MQQQKVDPIPIDISSASGTDHRNMFLYEDLSAVFRKKLTISGTCSVVFGCLLFILNLVQVFQNYRLADMGPLAAGVFTVYVGILCLVLCRQQVYVLKSLLALIIAHTIVLSVALLLPCLLLASSSRPQCKLTDEYCKGELRRYNTGIFLDIATIIILLPLLATLIFNYVVIIRERRVRKQTDNVDYNISRNDYLLTNIPSVLRSKFQKTGAAYIVIGVLLIVLDTSLLFNEPFSLFTGFISGIFSVAYGTVSLILSSERIYVLTSLFSLALWHLTVLFMQVTMTCFGLILLNCSHRDSSPDDPCKTGRIITAVSLIVVALSIMMTVWNMVLSIRGRRRQDNSPVRSPNQTVESFGNPIHGQN